MQKLALALALVAATIGGTATVFTLVTTHAACADGSGNGGGH